MGPRDRNKYKIEEKTLTLLPLVLTQPVSVSSQPFRVSRPLLAPVPCAGTRGWSPRPGWPVCARGVRWPSWLWRVLPGLPLGRCRVGAGLCFPLEICGWSRACAGMVFDSLLNQLFFGLCV